MTNKQPRGFNEWEMLRLQRRLKAWKQPADIKDLYIEDEIDETEEEHIPATINPERTSLSESNEPNAGKDQCY